MQSHRRVVSSGMLGVPAPASAWIPRTRFLVASWEFFPPFRGWSTLHPLSSWFCRQLDAGRIHQCRDWRRPSFAPLNFQVLEWHETWSFCWYLRKIDTKIAQWLLTHLVVIVWTRINRIWLVPKRMNGPWYCAWYSSWCFLQALATIMWSSH